MASRLGTKPSTVSEPFIIGTPATMMLSLIATVRPASGPPSVSRMSVATYHAPSWLSHSAGRDQGRSLRGVGAVRAYSSSTAVHELTSPLANGTNEAMSAELRSSP